MTLRVLAVAAPDRIAGCHHPDALGSRDPASLFNACRYAAYLASTSKTSEWRTSNWNTSRKMIRETFFLMHSLDDLQDLKTLLMQFRPNLLLIGAMTLCFPGAIACAEEARKILGKSVCVVLGGRHSSETMFIPKFTRRSATFVSHHTSSPLLLMQLGRIPHVFDLVVAGDGEYIVAEIGEVVGRRISQRPDVPVDPTFIIEALSRNVPGDWIAGAMVGHEMVTVVSAGNPIDYDALPSPAKMFGVSSSFDVFGNCMTAHVFSDTGRGCVYNCSFCSERQSATGGIQDISGAPKRLHRQLCEARDVILEEFPHRKPSAFIEDSILLGGSPLAIKRFIDLCEEDPPGVEFGAQLTVDLVLRRQPQLASLQSVGLRYIFIGIETISPEKIGGMSKDVATKAGSWISRVGEVLRFTTSLNISVGAAVLFGLGEDQADRLNLLQVLEDFRNELNSPCPISLNWAVQHPLCNEDGGTQYDYVSWGTPAGRMLNLFSRYGEASLHYPIFNVKPPDLHDLEEIETFMSSINASSDSRR